MKVNIHNNTDENINKYIKYINKVFDNINNEKSFELIFVLDDEIKKLNSMYRNIDKTTDVLSFPNDDSEFNSLGDVFININQAFKQAEDYKHTFIREICFLAVHGYLHLIGYDHETKEEEQKMIKMQEEILLKANITREF